jgi:hypothetical protein
MTPRERAVGWSVVVVGAAAAALALWWYYTTFGLAVPWG